VQSNGHSPPPRPLKDLLKELEVQPVGQVELGATANRPVQLPLAGGDIEVIGEAGGLVQDLDAPCGDTGGPERCNQQEASQYFGLSFETES
jgi:hypothetical protein